MNFGDWNIHVEWIGRETARKTVLEEMILPYVVIGTFMLVKRDECTIDNQFYIKVVKGKNESSRFFVIFLV